MCNEKAQKKKVQTKAMFPVNVYFYAQFVRELQTAVKLLEPGMAATHIFYTPVLCQTWCKSD